jgi:hypothetical protein
MRSLIPFLFILAVMVITPNQAEARVYVHVSMGGHINICLARALTCHPSQVVWTPAGWMCPRAYQVYIRFHPVHHRVRRHHAHRQPSRRHAQHQSPRRHHSRRRRR